MKQDDEKEIIRQRLRDALAKVPPRINSASYQSVVAYKSAHKAATKLVVKGGATTGQLLAAIEAVS